MKICIVGAGEVGTHLAKLLARENFNIVLMDASSERLRDLDANYDFLTVVGSPTSLKDLKEIGVEDADLFIAVTPHECVNITACMLASNLGAKTTLARIDNSEYMQPRNREFFKKMGVTHLIYPELLAAKEIAESLSTNWFRNHLILGDGLLEMLVIKVRANSEIVNKKFKTGAFDHDKYRIVAIKRQNETIIPGGNDEVLPNDLVCFVTSPENRKFVRTQAGKKLIDIKNVMFMGGSRIVQNAIRLLDKDMNIKLMEMDREKSFQLSERVDNALIINADGRNMDALKEEGITDMDAFVAVTGNSEANILACLAAKRFGVSKTIAEIENIDYIPLAEELDIGTVLNKKTIAASYIYQLTLDADVMDVRHLTSADAEVIEFVATTGSKITRHKVKDLNLPDQVNIGGLVRNGKAMLVNGNTLIMPNDRVIVFCTSAVIRKMEKFIN